MVHGFTATTKVATSVTGQYSALAARSVPAAGGLSGSAAMELKQATIGTAPTPTFLAATR